MAKANGHDSQRKRWFVYSRWLSSLGGDGGLPAGRQPIAICLRLIDTLGVLISLLAMRQLVTMAATWRFIEIADGAFDGACHYHITDV